MCNQLITEDCRILGRDWTWWCGNISRDFDSSVGVWGLRRKIPSGKEWNFVFRRLSSLQGVKLQKFVGTQNGFAEGAKCMQKLVIVYCSCWNDSKESLVASNLLEGLQNYNSGYRICWLSVFFFSFFFFFLFWFFQTCFIWWRDIFCLEQRVGLCGKWSCWNFKVWYELFIQKGWAIYPRTVIEIVCRETPGRTVDRVEVTRNKLHWSIAMSSRISESRLVIKIGRFEAEGRIHQKTVVLSVHRLTLLMGILSDSSTKRFKRDASKAS